MTLPCNFDYNGECLICDCWPADCAYQRLLAKDYKWESKEELDEMFKVYKDDNTDTMQITRKSTISGTETTRDLPITKDQWNQFTSGKGLIQNIFPNLSAYERDWLKHGFTEDEWNTLYGDNPRIDYTNTEALVSDIWLFLTNQNMPDKAVINKEAFFHEVSVMIDAVRNDAQKQE